MAKDDQEGWARVALRRSVFEKLKRRGTAISTSIEELLTLEESEIQRRLAKAKAELLAHASGWALGANSAGHHTILIQLPEPDEEGRLSLKLHATINGAEHIITLLHIGAHIVCLAPTFESPKNRVMVVPISQTGHRQGVTHGGV